MRNILQNYAANENNSNWNNIIKREKQLYKRNNDIRSDFERDYTRIIHSTAYRRLKHKTQVFFMPENDHICTRIEHVVLVESISYTIAKYLGLNTELTKAIATAHDIGHSPFGHMGERILSEISMNDIGERFWHEKNGLDMVDKIELLEDPEGNKQNLNLTYAVRDGIISHCGEIDENMLKPREEVIDLKEYKTPNQYSPYTWEGCVVKIADKISYLGRDIADAITLGVLDGHLTELYDILKFNGKIINNTVLTNHMIYDLCENSNPEQGLCFSPETFKLINDIKKFNYKNIYLTDKKMSSMEYIRFVLTGLYNALKDSYKNREKAEELYPELMKDFENFLNDYWNLERKINNKNDILFNMENEKDYYRAIIYYISGMTDNYAIKMFNKIIGF
ncbi:MAG: HD domain-containing protein [Clostridia bacterium]|nr:HD domain-containing protein [Clostridia bacterium]